MNSIVSHRDLMQLHPFQVLRLYSGYYKCPKDSSGKRLGPLAGYAGEYEPGKFWVGDVYANYAKIECEALPHHYYCQRLLQMIASADALDGLTGFCGLPEGGKSIAVMLQHLSGLKYIYPEKKVTEAKREGRREISSLEFSRHEPEAGTRWILVEDVVNNYSSADKNVKLFTDCGATVVGLACFLDRSVRDVRQSYTTATGQTFPVWPIVDQPIPQFKQDDPFVADDVAAGNVIWKPKIQWSELAAAMKAHTS